MAKMYLMSGPSGAGKTTFAKKFAEEHGIQYLGIDDFYRMFNGSESLHEDEFDVWMAFYKAIHLAEQKGRDIIVDTNAPSVSSRTEFLNWFPTFEHYLFFIDAPFELCVRNNQSRTRRVPYDEMKRIYSSIQRPTQAGDPRWIEITCYSNKKNDGYALWADYLHGRTNQDLE